MFQQKNSAAILLGILILGTIIFANILQIFTARHSQMVSNSMREFATPYGTISESEQ